MTGPDTGGVSLRIEDLTVTVEGRTLLQRISAQVRGGELVVLLGPNGAGKTTLLRCAIGLTAPDGGRVLIDGHDTRDLPAVSRARLLSYLPQSRVLAWPLLVEDAVALGRFAYGAAPGRLAEKDARAVERALSACDLTSFAERQTDTLSGGEMARVHFARAFAAQTPLLIADEPVASLDPLHQFQIMTLLREYVNDGGGALVILHDIALAARFADRLLWLHEGRLVADGTPDDTLTPERLQAVFAMEATVDPTTGYGLDVRFRGTARPAERER